MTSLLVRPGDPGPDGVLVEVTPESAGWTYVGFRVVRVSAGRGYANCEKDREACIVVLSGTVNVSVNGIEFPDLGQRESVFDGAATGMGSGRTHAHRSEN